jgi:hypothetical protein
MPAAVRLVRDRDGAVGVGVPRTSRGMTTFLSRGMTTFLSRGMTTFLSQGVTMFFGPGHDDVFWAGPRRCFLARA